MKTEDNDLHERLGAIMDQNPEIKTYLNSVEEHIASIERSVELVVEQNTALIKILVEAGMYNHPDVIKILNGEIPEAVEH